MPQTLTLNRAVGTNQMNHAADLAAARTALAARGLCARGLPGLSGVHLKADLTAAIRTFQRRHGFDPDGVITPDGPTARALGGEHAYPGAQIETAGIRETCQDIQRKIDRLNGEIARFDRQVRSLESLERSLEGRLSSLTSGLKSLLAGLRLGAFGGFNMPTVRELLDGLPDPQQAAARQARALSYTVESVRQELATVRANLKSADGSRSRALSASKRNRDNYRRLSCERVLRGPEI